MDAFPLTHAYYSFIIPYSSHDSKIYWEWLLPAETFLHSCLLRSFICPSSPTPLRLQPPHPTPPQRPKYSSLHRAVSSPPAWSPRVKVCWFNPCLMLSQLVQPRLKWLQRPGPSLPSVHLSDNTSPPEPATAPIWSESWWEARYQCLPEKGLRCGVEVEERFAAVNGSTGELLKAGLLNEDNSAQRVHNIL